MESTGGIRFRAFPSNTRAIHDDADTTKLPLKTYQTYTLLQTNILYTVVFHPTVTSIYSKY